MNNQSRAGDDALAKAQETITRQAEEIARLRQRLADEGIAEKVREAFTLAATTGTIASPVTHNRLLEMIVETAAHVINARFGSLFLIDQETHELVFEVSLREKVEQLKQHRVPLGHGIAGMVALSGQPIAVSDAQDDPRQAADIAQRTGYTPQSILCVPLFYNDQIIGVLELLDKEGRPSFNAADMDALGLFANLAAVAIEQSYTHHNLAALIDELMISARGTPDNRRQGLRREAQAFAVRIQEEDVAYRQALDLARLVQEIVSKGDNEFNACRTILQGFAQYLRLRPEPAGDVRALQ